MPVIDHFPIATTGSTSGLCKSNSKPLSAVYERGAILVHFLVSDDIDETEHTLKVVRRGEEIRQDELAFMEYVHTVVVGVTPLFVFWRM